tara:strand:- start:1572 stop:2537 length:966 start_codon:yes stop_codon:yes gene_type:complete
MNKPLAIIAGEPNSIASEIIFKSWMLKKSFKHKPIIVIGSYHLLNMQKKKLNYQIKMKEINSNFKLKNINKNELLVYNVSYRQKKPFQEISTKSNSYIFKCFHVAFKLIKNKKIIGFINCPVSKEHLLKKKYEGITEFLSKNSGVKGNEVMLIYNKKLSVSPLTTHIPLKKVAKKIDKFKIYKNIKIINNFYKKKLRKKPKIAVLGLNPHNYSPELNSEEKRIIYPAVKKAKSMGFKVVGPVSPDTSFLAFNEQKFDVILGMYHDQVLTPFKTLFKYSAINITLGLPYTRISPDHGVAKNIIGKGKANPASLIESIKFFNN